MCSEACTRPYRTAGTCGRGSEHCFAGCANHLEQRLDNSLDNVSVPAGLQELTAVWANAWTMSACQAANRAYFVRRHPPHEVAINFGAVLQFVTNANEKGILHLNRGGASNGLVAPGSQRCIAIASHAAAIHILLLPHAPCIGADRRFLCVVSFAPLPLRHPNLR